MYYSKFDTLSEVKSTIFEKYKYGPFKVTGIKDSVVKCLPISQENTFLELNLRLFFLLLFFAFVPLGLFYDCPNLLHIHLALCPLDAFYDLHETKWPLIIIVNKH